MQCIKFLAWLHSSQTGSASEDSPAPPADFTPGIIISLLDFRLDQTRRENFSF